MNLVERVKNIVLTPKTEWPVIAAEPATVPGLYKGYIAILAAIPAVANFIKGSLIGHSVFGVTFRVPFFSGLMGAVLSYVLSLAAVYVMALVADALAPTFNGEKNPMQALKVVAYAASAAWIAAIALIVPGVGPLIYLVGALYSIPLLYWGLPVLMKCPPGKAAGYAALIFVCGFVLSLLVGLVMGGIVGAGAGAGAMLGGATGPSWGGQASIDPNSALGKIAAASQQMEAAEKSGDRDAQAKAMGNLLSTTLGGGDQVEALAPDLLKPFVPETLGSLKRTRFSAERNGAMGVQTSAARASYSDGADHTLDLDISDMGSMKGLASLAGLVGAENVKETDHGYDKTYKQDGRLVHEQWDSQTKRGEFSIVLGERFSVKLAGHADSVDELKVAVASLDLAGLEALKNQGVKK
jgi:hypothetical protein